MSAIGLAATWIGAQSPGGFIQIGINEGRLLSPSYVNGGFLAAARPVEYAFWSDTALGFHPVPLGSVAPGDTVHSSLTLAHGRWWLKMTDSTSGSTFDLSTPQETADPPNIAEWQQEDVEADTRTGQLFPYPELSALRFRDLRVNGAQPVGAQLSASDPSRAELRFVVGPLRDDAFTVTPAAGYEPPRSELTDPDLAIPGAPGYSTFTGPHGKPLAVGQPWGRPCQPVRIGVAANVSNWAYSLIDAVVLEARYYGIDVVLENRDLSWSPGWLYYLHGQSPATTVQVAIFAKDGRAPLLANGHPEHIELGWNARLDADDQHEALTNADGVLYMRTIGSDARALTHSIRFLIAMTQGITGAPAGSSFAEATGVDHFTRADVAAMQRMSGCGAQPSIHGPYSR